MIEKLLFLLGPLGVIDLAIARKNVLVFFKGEKSSRDFHITSDITLTSAPLSTLKGTHFPPIVISHIF